MTATPAPASRDDDTMFRDPDRQDLEWAGDGATVDGVRVGLWEFHFEDDAALQVSYVDGDLQGPYTFWRADGTVERGCLEGGLTHGSCEFWRESTLVQHLNFDRGVLNGEQLHFDDTKTQSTELAYGRVTGTRMLWIGEELIERDRWIDGVPVGELEAWYPTGERRLATQFDGGLLDGPVTLWHKTGAVLVDGQFDAGIPIDGWTLHDKHGDPIETIVPVDLESLPEAWPSLQIPWRAIPWVWDLGSDGSFEQRYL